MSVEERINQIAEESRRRTDAALQEAARAFELRLVEIRRQQERDTYRVAFMMTLLSISLAAMPAAILAIVKILASS